MKTQKISLLLAVFMSAGMFLTGIAIAASADPGPGPASESIFLEIQASGKGFDAESDNASAPAPGIVYNEEKHKFEKTTLYAMCDLSNEFFRLAYYNEASGTWARQSGRAIETENSVMVRFSGGFPIYVDANGQAILTTGTLRVQFKLQDEIFKSAKLQSLAMSYWQTKDLDPGNAQLLGALKMKGKMVDTDDMPTGVQGLFGLLP